jgi:hypothetical protein
VVGHWPAIRDRQGAHADERRHPKDLLGTLLVVVDTRVCSTLRQLMLIDWLRPTCPLLAAVFALTACVDAPVPTNTAEGNESSDEAGTTTDTGDTETYTWHRDVQPIVAEKCGTCHVAGDIAPFALTTYENAIAVAPILAPSIESGEMPPWPPAAGCSEYTDSRALTDEQREVLLTWLDEGTPEGDPADAAPTPGPAPAWEPDVLIEMPEPYTPTKSPDDYHCFLIDGPELDSTQYVTGFEVFPGQRSMVHHVIAYLVLPSALEDFEAFDAAEEGPGYTCFGSPTGAGDDGSAFTGVRWIGSWAPGGGHWIAPEGTGMAVQPGSKVVIQMHYNTAPGSTMSDLSSVGFELSPTVEQPAIMMPFTSFSWFSGGMSIPAGDPSVIHVHNGTRTDELVQFALAGIGAGPSDTVYIRDASLHMHLLGRQAEVSVKHESGDESCLLYIDDWDFGWQGSYSLEQAVELGPNDVLQLACEWDNSAENQPIVDGQPRVPVDVNWGEGTFDEMCLAVLYAHR